MNYNVDNPKQYDESTDYDSKTAESTHHSRLLAVGTATIQPKQLDKSNSEGSSSEIPTDLLPDEARDNSSIALPSSSVSVSESPEGQSTPSRFSHKLVGSDDNVSLASFTTTLKVSNDLVRFLNERLRLDSPVWKILSSQPTLLNAIETKKIMEFPLENFEKEFDEIDSVDITRENEDKVILQWKEKWKHYFILSSAGKPIYSRHGDLNLINGYIGIIQTIISFFQESDDTLMGFTAQETRFVVSTYGPLYLVAVSRLKESDSQIRAQLEALYMQILSTLTLPTLTQLFTNRPNTDLRRPLEGTEALLSSLADTFTRGSPSALLSALECLKLRRSHRHLIDKTFLKARTDKLLYGLIVAGGKLVSVVRPKRHSLHPSDLQLIFNMLFEAKTVKAGGGECWIPICLPGFNNQGYLYMYVSFLSISREEESRIKSVNKELVTENEIAILLISTDKHSFFDLKQMRDDTIAELEKNGGLDIIQKSVLRDHLNIAEIVPGTQLQHFLYKSRPNVQFTMPTFSPHFNDLLAQRRLMSLYHNLHESVHSKHSHLKLLYCMGCDSISLAWNTPIFEFYCVAGPSVSRADLTQGANKIIQWLKREHERIFIIGGAVF
ncbi:Vacuolar fusion protein [Podosphaera aphanis]|nr:Vacuolar fusion protein [Podosphaera aphanis]